MYCLVCFVIHLIFLDDSFANFKFIILHFLFLLLIFITNHYNLKIHFQSQQDPVLILVLNY